MRRAITCVYCEPKSRMRIFECVRAIVFTLLRMSLRHAVFGRWIAGLALLRADCALAGNAALKLRLHFFSAAVFQWIAASAHDQPAGESHQDRQAFHLSILESKPSIAIAKERLDRINRIYRIRTRILLTVKSCPSCKPCLVFCLP